MATNFARCSKPIMGLVLVLTLTLAVQAAAPTGWFPAGTKPASYEAGTDASAAYNGHPSAYLNAKEPDPGGFGTLMQDFRADKLRR